jgi:beta-lactamase regulating signal transducer with metallopeptidase domain/peptidoglycan/xylan/chitin deacetylase (PgdA/CDA1 family)
VTTADDFLDPQLLRALGLTLVHFLWQGTLVALLYASFSALARAASAHARYLAACLALLLMLALPAATFYLKLNQRPAQPVSESFSDARDGRDPARERARGAARGESAPPPHARDARDDARGETPGWRAWAETRHGALAPWLAVAWALGVLLLALRTCGGWLAVRRLRAQARAVAGPAREAFARLASRLGVARAAGLWESAAVEVPSVVGFLRPVVLVPASALVGLTPAQLEAVLAHELAHIRRHDYLVNLLQTAVETLLFYHPAVWWVSREARAEREHACDDAAVRATGDAFTYARALAALEHLRRGPAPAPALALAADGGSLMKRIKRLVHLDADRERRRARPALFALLLLLLCGGAAARALFVEEAGAHGLTPAAGQRREVAVTFVSFPGNIHDDGRLANKTRKLLRSLAAHDARAVAFVNEARLYREDGALHEARVQMLREWLDAGHELGNETFGHTNLYNVSVEKFQSDVLRGEQIMRKLVAERGGRLRYFSYPYLNTGPNPEARAAVEKFLQARGYEIHPVTVDNMDWLFSRAYIEALRREDEAAAAAIRAEYVPYMERMFEFFEQYSREVVGREFPQVLMLTAGALNADAFDDLAAMLKRRGYSFVTMEQAMRDPAYKTPDTYTGLRGDSWIARWAVSKGMEYKDSEENLPPLMEKYFADFRKEMARKEKGKEK